MSFGSEFVLTLFTNNPKLASLADEAGIDRIGLDLERFGKDQRQDKSSCWISDHEEPQLAEIRRAIGRAQLFARINPIHTDSAAEIDRVIEHGAQVLMLPMFRTADEVEFFVRCVSGRAQTVLLLETPQAAARIHDILEVDEINEIHIGLNDLYLGLGLRSHFEVLTSGILEMLSDMVQAAGIRFGFGGIGRVDDPRLPVPSRLIYPQYPRLQGSMALISRVFLSPDPQGIDIRGEVRKARQYLDFWASHTEAELEEALRNLRSRVAQI